MTTTEKYFEALGWVKKTSAYSFVVWIHKDGIAETLPNITQSYPDFKKWVLEKMEGEGWRFFTIFNYATFADKDGNEIDAEIKNNEILEAAVEAATRYFSQKDTSC